VGWEVWQGDWRMSAHESFMGVIKLCGNGCTTVDIIKTFNCILFFCGAGVKSRAFHMLKKHSNNETHPQPLVF
jgi:hypothetical protein